MVLLTVTSPAKEAIEEYCKLQQNSDGFEEAGVKAKWEELLKAEIGSAIDHNDLIQISTFLLQRARQGDDSALGREWRLDTLLKGANVYQAPPLPKPEPVSSQEPLEAGKQLIYIDI